MQTNVRIADINVEFNTKYYKLSSLSKDFLFENSKPEKMRHQCCTEEEIDRELANAHESIILPSFCEAACACRAFCNEIWKDDAILCSILQLLILMAVLLLLLPKAVSGQNNTYFTMEKAIGR